MPRKSPTKSQEPAAKAHSSFTAEGLAALMQGVKDGGIPVDQALEFLAVPPGMDLDFAVLDAHRPLRSGLPEVVYGAGKTAAQVAILLRHLHAIGQPAIATRVDGAKAAEVQAVLPEVVYHDVARVLVWSPDPPAAPPAVLGDVGVLCAGTSDLPVFEEAAVVLEAFGQPVRRFRDVGVAGLHRVLGRVHELRACRVLIVVAGMEGALPSVVAGLVGRPVIAVPTSVGYGAAFGGIAALLGMLNACAPGVAVVNIDNGFGAAAMAALLNRG
jgi:pyridinium-3,5-biscarboxylic acid mononucleotide synthase